MLLSSGPSLVLRVCCALFFFTFGASAALSAVSCPKGQVATGFPAGAQQSCVQSTQQGTFCQRNPSAPLCAVKCPPGQVPTGAPAGGTQQACVQKQDQVKQCGGTNIVDCQHNVDMACGKFPMPSRDDGLKAAAQGILKAKGWNIPGGDWTPSQLNESIVGGYLQCGETCSSTL